MGSVQICNFLRRSWNSGCGGVFFFFLLESLVKAAVATEGEQTYFEDWVHVSRPAAAFQQNTEVGFFFLRK